MARRLSALVLVLLAGAACGEEPPADVPGGDAARGKALIVEYGCGGCHDIPGIAQADGRVGPSLEDFAGERYIAGEIPNSADNLTEWIRDPRDLEPGTLMPDLGVEEDEARDIAAYLYCCT